MSDLASDPAGVTQPENGEAAQPAAAVPEAQETVDVVCLLDHGLVVTLLEKDPIYSTDDDTLKIAPGDNAVVSLAGGGATTTLPAKAARKWFADHADFDPVLSGMVYIAE